MRRLFILIALLLTACYSAPSTNIPIDTPPVNLCSVKYFSCNVLQDNNNDVGLSLQNNLGFGLSSVLVTLNTTDCVLQQTTINAGNIPKDAITPVHFTCVSGVPNTFSAKITLQYVANGAADTLNGVISMRS